MDGQKRRLGIGSGLAALAGAFSLGWPTDGASEIPFGSESVTIDTTDEIGRGPRRAPTPPTAVPTSTTPTSEYSHPDDAPSPTRTVTTNPSTTEGSDARRAPLETSFTDLPDRPPLAHLPEAVCAESTDSGELTRLFGAAGPIIGADYQRAFPLPDGRVLWLFQDAFISTATGPELVHNAGLLQSGQCVQPLVGGSSDRPTSYLFADTTDPFRRWFWPLGGGLGNDGRLHVYVAEVHERGQRYLQNSEPTATWLVSIDVEDFSVHDVRPAPDPSADLYGWSVVSHGEHTYLYAHCYRQFGWAPFPFTEAPAVAHDWSCTAVVTVARIPRGEFDALPEYWNGSTWSSDSSSAVPVIETEGRSVNATQVAVLDGRFVAVTKVGDWWGNTIALDTAAAPEGPWHTYGEIEVEADCARCNTYFASFVPFGQRTDSVMIGLSRNTFDGDDLDRYSPRFLRVPTPPAGDGASR